MAEQVLNAALAKVFLSGCERCSNDGFWDRLVFQVRSWCWRLRSAGQQRILW